MKTKKKKVLDLSQSEYPLEYKYVNKEVTNKLVSSECASAIKSMEDTSLWVSYIDQVLDSVYLKVAEKYNITNNDIVDTEALRLICNQKTLEVMDNINNAAIIEMQDI